MPFFGDGMKGPNLICSLFKLIRVLVIDISPLFSHFIV
jgi:hypothetical protein